MKPWKAVSLILFALAVAAAGYGLILVRRGFSALATPSAIEEVRGHNGTQIGRAILVPRASQSHPAFNGEHSGRHGAFRLSLRLRAIRTTEGANGIRQGPLSETARLACSRDTEQESDGEPLLHN